MPSEAEDLCAVIQNASGHPFARPFAYFERALPRGASGNFDGFMCKAAAA